MEAPQKTESQTGLAEPHPNDHALVEITINAQQLRIRRGHHTVVELKNLGHVPLADDLEQIINGQMHLLPDDGAVVIHGQEVFVSHPKSTSSS